MKRKLPSAAVFIISIFIFSCSGKFKTSDQGYYFQDFDNLKLWARDVNVTNEHAHSGSYSAFTDSTHEYSATFEMELSFARLKGYKIMVVTAWCMMKDFDTKAGLITSVESAERTLAYQSAELSSFLNSTNEWGKVTKFIKIPEGGPVDSKIKIYVWAPKKHKTFLDDVEIQFEK